MKLLLESIRDSAYIPVKNKNPYGEYEDSGYDALLDIRALTPDLIKSDFYGEFIIEDNDYEKSLTILPSTRVKIPLGWKVKLEHTYFYLNATDINGNELLLPVLTEVQVRTKSGLGHKEGLVITLGIGTIDSRFPGEVMASITNISQKEVKLLHGQKVCQLVPALVLNTEATIVKAIDFNSYRNESGFGSTGV